MKIAHFALWTQQLDVQARFWGGVLCRQHQ
ncbi:Lactoylglutathione lyase [Klebsiella variicola]|uniref:Lactoylglutathione lyase n=1 Tax=Klebsiella variicola TaxID=244366 RepID=A0A7H4MLI3_KLEVA|nr:Lactoylglutathione lyase [Klebsiella variicola]